MCEETRLVLVDAPLNEQGPHARLSSGSRSIRSSAREESMVYRIWSTTLAADHQCRILEVVQAHVSSTLQLRTP
eukprot:7326270-Pyramimonas_sp.AAC.4